MTDEFDNNDIVFRDATGVVCPICGGETDWIDNSYGGLSPACRNRKCRIYAQPMLSDASPKDTIAALQAEIDELRSEAASGERWADEYYAQAQALQAEVDRMKEVVEMVVAYGEIWKANGIILPSEFEFVLFDAALHALEGGE